MNWLVVFGIKVFPSRVEPLYEEAWWLGEQTETRKRHLWWNMAENVPRLSSQVSEFIFEVSFLVYCLLCLFAFKPTV